MVNKEDKRKEILDEEGGLFKVAVSIQHGPEPHSVLGFQEDVRGWWGSCYHSSGYGRQRSCPDSFCWRTPPVPKPPGHQLWVRVKQREHQQQQQFCRQWTPVWAHQVHTGRKISTVFINTCCLSHSANFRIFRGNGAFPFFYSYTSGKKHLLAIFITLYWGRLGFYYSNTCGKKTIVSHTHQTNLDSN